MPDRTLQARKLEEKGFGVGFQTISVVYNGREMTKAELIAYFYELTRLQREIEELPKKAQSLSNQMESLKLQKRRKEFTMPQMEPPKGLAALSSRRKREYQRWLDDAPKREEEMRRKKAEEDARLEEVNRKSEAAFNELMSLNGKGQELAKQRDDLLLLQVIAPDYRGGHIPELLMNYLFNGRAQTLSEAINVYHTEKHQQEMYMLAEQQRRDAQMAQQRQLDLAWQQMNMLRQQTEMQSEALKAAKEARDAAKNAELWSWISMLDNY